MSDEPNPEEIQIIEQVENIEKIEEVPDVDQSQVVETPNGEQSQVPNPSPFIWVKGKLVEYAPPVVLVPRKLIKTTSRRDLILFGAGMVAAVSGYKWLLPNDGDESSLLGRYKKNLLEEVNTFDDAVAKLMYSPTRMVPTYSKSQLTDLPNNYAGATPDGVYLQDWKLKLSGLASGHDLLLNANQLRNDFAHFEIISRMVCVEGWSAIAWWGGLRFADLMLKYPPKPDTKWVKLTSDVNLDADGNSDPYFVSMDLASALHQQTLLATHHNGSLLEVEHGAPLRLLAPTKLGLKNIKAITSIAYSAHEPEDYWNKEGYSYYDGI